MVFGVSRFKDRVAVIAGAEHPLGTSLVRRMAAFGATVVAIGQDEAQLYGLARELTGRVEPLALAPGRRDVLALLYDAWGDEPLDIYVDVMPLCTGTDLPDPAERFARSAGVAAALVRGIRQARAFAVMAVPLADTGAPPPEQARSAGYGAMMRRLSADCRPGRMVGLGLPGASDPWTDAACLSAGDAILALCHPVTRGLAGGQLLHWEPEATGTRRDSMGHEA